MSEAESRSGSEESEVPPGEKSPSPPPSSVKRVIDTNLLMARAIREGTPPKATAEVESTPDSVKVQPEATETAAAVAATAEVTTGEEEPPKPKLKKRTIIRRIVRKKKVLPKKDEKFFVQTTDE